MQTGWWARRGRTGFYRGSSCESFVHAFSVFLDFGRGRCRLVVCSSRPHLFSIILHAQHRGDKNIYRKYI
jgi:hypothetical protein